MTPEIIAQAYKDAGVTTQKDIADGVKQAIIRVEDRISGAYTNLPAEQAHVATKRDRVLLKAQVSFLDHLEGKREK